MGITFLGGQLLSWAAFEVIAIPCMLFIKYGAFKYCTNIYMVAELVLFVCGLITAAIKIRRTRMEDTLSDELRVRNFRSFKHQLDGIFPGEMHATAEDYMNPRGNVYGRRLTYSMEGRIMWIIFFLILCFQLYMAAFYWSFDGDDAYYVVESVLAQQTDTMNTINPYVGGSTSIDIRHALAVITMWIGYIAKISGLHATILSHMILPLYLIPITYLIYVEIGHLLFSRDPNLLPMFMTILAVFQMFGYTSMHTSETFFLTRTWQGKSMLGNIAIPLLIWLFLWISEDLSGDRIIEETRLERRSPWIWMILVNMASGIFSSLGVMLGSVLIGVYTMVLTIRYRKPGLIFLAFITLIPNAIYTAMYVLIR